MRLIEILGAGCPRCGHLESATREAISRTGQSAEIRRVTDFAEIGARGLMSLPGLVIDGRSVCAGRVPTVHEIEAWLREEVGPAAEATEATEARALEPAGR